VLAVQGLVVAELVGDNPRNEAHIGPAPLDDAHRGCRTGDHLGIAALDHRAHVLEDDVAARTLGEAVADLLADHLVLIRGEPVDSGLGTSMV
jgi:hypothetical protein